MANISKIITITFCLLLPIYAVLIVAQFVYVLYAERNAPGRIRRGSNFEIFPNAFLVLFAATQAIWINAITNLVFALVFASKICVIYFLCKIWAKFAQKFVSKFGTKTKPEDRGKIDRRNWPIAPGQHGYFARIYTFFFQILVDHKLFAEWFTRNIGSQTNTNCKTTIKTSKNRKSNYCNSIFRIFQISCFANLSHFVKHKFFRRFCASSSTSAALSSPLEPSNSIETADESNMNHMFNSNDNNADLAQASTKTIISIETDNRIDQAAAISCNEKIEKNNHNSIELSVRSPANRNRVARITARFASTATCSMITRSVCDALQIRGDKIFPIPLRQSITGPLQICCESAWLSIESMHSFGDYFHHDHHSILHDNEFLIVESDNFGYVYRENNDDKSGTKKRRRRRPLHCLIGQDLLNWSFNRISYGGNFGIFAPILIAAKNNNQENNPHNNSNNNPNNNPENNPENNQPNNSNNNNNKLLIKNSREQNSRRLKKIVTRHLPWNSRICDDEEQKSTPTPLFDGIIRDLQIFLVILFAPGLFTVFDYYFRLILFLWTIGAIASLLLPSFCALDLDRARQLATHYLSRDIFVLVYALRIFWRWAWHAKADGDPKGERSSQIDRNTYKPIIKIRVSRSTKRRNDKKDLSNIEDGKNDDNRDDEEVEVICRAILDTDCSRSRISRRVLPYFDYSIETKPDDRNPSEDLKTKSDIYEDTIRVRLRPMEQCEQQESTVDLHVDNCVFFDYLPAPPQSLRQAISIQEGIQLSDDNRPDKPFSSVDIIFGTDLLASTILSSHPLLRNNGNNISPLPKQLPIMLSSNLSLEPTRFGWTLTGSRTPVLCKKFAQNVVYGNERNSLQQIWYHIFSFIIRSSAIFVSISVLFDFWFHLIATGTLAKDYSSNYTTTERCE